jgi:hypothetical protein
MNVLVVHGFNLSCAPPRASVKTIGRPATGEQSKRASVSSKSTGVTRAAVRERVAARLGRKITPAGQMTENELVELMTRLE